MKFKTLLVSILSFAVIPPLFISMVNLQYRQEVISNYSGRPMDKALRKLCLDDRVKTMTVEYPTGYRTEQQGAELKNSCPKIHWISVYSENDFTEISVVLHHNLRDGRPILSLPFSLYTTIIYLRYNGGDFRNSKTLLTSPWT